MLAVAPPGKVGLAIRVWRNATEVVLPLAEPAASEVRNLAASMGVALGSLSGPIIRSHGSHAHALSYCAARNIVRAACRATGLPIVTAVDLRTWLDDCRGIRR